MRIIDELQNRVFTENFADKLRDCENSLSAFLGHVSDNEESVFLNTFANETRNNLPGKFSSISN